MYVSCYPPIPKLHECFLLLIQYIISFLISVMAAILIQLSALKVFKAVLFISHSFQQTCHPFSLLFHCHTKRPVTSYKWVSLPDSNRISSILMETVNHYWKFQNSTLGEACAKWNCITTLLFQLGVGCHLLLILTSPKKRFNELLQKPHKEMRNQ
jgi:hypothetical protein